MGCNLIWFLLDTYIKQKLIFYDHIKDNLIIYIINMPQKPTQTNKSTKKKLVSEETLKEKKIIGDELSEESGVSSNNESELSDTDTEKDIDNLGSEKYDEVDDDDALGDEGNEVDDEDDNDQKSDSTEDEEEQNEESEKEEDNDNDDCLYKFSKKKKDMDVDEDIDEDFFFEDDTSIKNPDDTFVQNDQRITKPVLTKYERVRILGERSRQISLGAKPMIKGLTNMNPKEVAKLELQMKVVPMKLIRILPTGKKERWSINELEIVN